MAKFLIVDDDPDDRDMFCEAISALDPDSDCFRESNGRRALRALDNGEITLPDVLFLDINMPVMNGWECLSRLKKTEAFRNIPVIMYSTSSYPEDLEKAARLGALCFFSKPSSFKQLKNTLALVFHHLNNGSLASLAQSSPLFSTGASG